MIEQRKDYRAAVRCPVRFALEEQAGVGEIYNLSLGGCAIESETLSMPGDTISLQIVVGESEPPIAVELGHIRWASRRELGVQFEIMSSENRRHLERFLARVPRMTS